MKLIDTELGGTTPLDIILKFENEEKDYEILEEDIYDEDAEFEDDIFS